MSRQPETMRISPTSRSIQCVQLTQKPAEHDEGPQSADQNIVALLSSFLWFRICSGYQRSSRRSGPVNVIRRTRNGIRRRGRLFGRRTRRERLSGRQINSRRPRTLRNIWKTWRCLGRGWPRKALAGIGGVTI